MTRRAQWQTGCITQEWMHVASYRSLKASLAVSTRK